MSLELALLPFDHDSGDRLSFSHTVLRTYGGYDLQKAINGLNQLPVPKGFTSYLSRDDAFEETHYGVTEEDPYGERVKYTTAGELLTLHRKFRQEPRPTWAYIEALPSDTKVALYWS